MIQNKMNKKSSKISCICNSTNIVKTNHTYLKPDMFDGSIFKKYNRFYYKCEICGLYFSNYTFLKKKLNKIYKFKYTNLNNNYDFQKFIKITNLPLSVSENRQRAILIKKIISNKKIFKNKKVRLLDYGGGAGYFSYEMQDKKYICYTYDEAKKPIFSNEFKLKYVKKKNIKNFDIVTLNYVLEHIKNPVIFLKKIIKLLKKNGLIYIEIPNDKNFIYLKKTNVIFNSLHLYFFNSFNIKNLLEKLKLKIFYIKNEKSPRKYYILKVLCSK
jgi:2-polyprenyl-3-methyl-5-hydroxy-6-metoxy-1,4-benzoquinol methylase